MARDLSSIRHDAASITHAFEINPEKDLKKLAKTIEHLCDYCEVLEKKVEEAEREAARAKREARR
jgi:hypothetical protein